MEAVVAPIFEGDRARWRAAYDALVARVAKLGPDVRLAATPPRVRLLRGGRAFAVVEPSPDRLDVGVALRAVAPTKRFAAAGAWDDGVTHRAGIRDASEIDAELLAWLRWAYAAAR